MEELCFSTFRYVEKNIKESDNETYIFWRERNEYTNLNFDETEAVYEKT